MGAQVAHVPPRPLTRPTRPSYDHQHNVLLPPRSRPHTFALARARPTTLLLQHLHRYKRRNNTHD